MDAYFATVYAEPEGRPLVDTFATEVSQDTCIYLPWDMGLAFTPADSGWRQGMTRIRARPAPLPLGHAILEHFGSAGRPFLWCFSNSSRKTAMRLMVKVDQ